MKSELLANIDKLSNAFEKINAQKLRFISLTKEAIKIIQQQLNISQIDISSANIRIKADVDEEEYDYLLSYIEIGQHEVIFLKSLNNLYSMPLTDLPFECYDKLLTAIYDFVNDTDI